MHVCSCIMKIGNFFVLDWRYCKHSICFLKQAVNYKQLSMLACVVDSFVLYMVETLNKPSLLMNF